MKSSTRNQINPQALRADKRFDAIVRKQEIEQQHVLSGHHKEMQMLRDSLLLAQQKFESLSQKNEQELKDFKTYMLCSLGTIKEKLKANEEIVAGQKKTIESLHEQFNRFHETYASKMAMEKLKSDGNLAIKANTLSHLNSLQELQRLLNISINNLKDDLKKLRADTALTVAELDTRIESNFSISRIDREGVLKEVRIWDKTIFIIEKKIENIYTLIERINKRGESCHKLE